MGKNLNETIDEMIALYDGVITICNKLVALLEPLQNLNLTSQLKSVILYPESEGKH